MNKRLIIGGGISGLVRAYKYCAQGASVVLFEPHQLGGVAQTIHRQGFTIETGPSVLALKPAISELLSELGLTSDIVFPAVEPFRQYVWFEGSPVAVKKSPFALFTSPLFRRSESLHLLTNVLRRNRFMPQGEDETVADFFSRIIGPFAVRAVLEPALQGIFGGNIDRLSARSLFPGLWEHLIRGGSLLQYGRAQQRRRIFVIRGGVERLIAAVKQRCGDRLTVVASAVRSLHPEQLALEVEGGASYQGSSIDICTSGAATASFLPEGFHELRSELNSLTYAPLVMMHFQVPATITLPDKGFGVLFPPNRESGLLGVMFNSQLFPHLAPPGAHLITCCLGGVGREQVLKNSDGRLIETVSKELAETLGISSDIVSLAITRWPRAIPQYELGHYRLEARIRETEQRFPGLRFFGADIGGVGVPDRVQSTWSAQ